MALKPLSWTYVVYEEGDGVGYLMALLSLSPFFILAGYATLILFRRDLHTIFMLLGQLLNNGLNLTLKHSIQEKRPHAEISAPNSGMPSAHAQFMMFFAVYMMLFVTKRATIQRMHEKALTGLLCHFWAVAVSYSRVYLNYHTIAQVTVGSTVGILSGSIWFYLINSVIAPKYFPKLERTWLAIVLLIRDSSYIHDLIAFDYHIVGTIREETANKKKD